MSDDHRTPQLPDPDPAAVDRLRRTLHAVAAATPVRDRRDDLVADLADLDDLDDPDDLGARAGTAGADRHPLDRPEEDDAMALAARAGAPTPIWRRPLFLAAAAALVLAVAVGVLAGRGSDEPVELDPVEPPVVPASGWYLPPDGWEITEVRADFVDVGEGGTCPCRYLIASAGGASPSTLLVVESERSTLDGFDGTDPVDVGGRDGRLFVYGTNIPIQALEAEGGGVHVTVFSARVDARALAAVADAWLDRIEAGEEVDPSALPLPEGMSPGRLQPFLAERAAHIVDVAVVETATGRRAHYQLAPGGSELLATVMEAMSVRQLGDQFAFRASTLASPAAGRVGSTVDVLVGPSWFAEPGDLDIVEAEAFLEGLQPATAEEWRAALQGVPVDPVLEEAETLLGPPLVDTSIDDLVDG